MGGREGAEGISWDLICKGHSLKDPGLLLKIVFSFLLLGVCLRPFVNIIDIFKFFFFFFFFWCGLLSFSKN